MPWDAGNINILHARSVRKTRTETTQQIAVPHGLPWISGNFYFLYMGGGSLTHHLSHNFVTLQFRKPLCHTPSFTHHLWHTLFHTPSFTPLCHTPSFMHHLSHTTLSPTIFDTPSFTHSFVTHHLSHTTLSHTIFQTPSFTHHLSPHHLSHTQLCHTPSFATHLSHTTFSQTIFHTQLCHTLCFTHNFHTHHLSNTSLSHTHTHTIFLCHTPSFTYNFVTHNFVLLLDPPPPPLSFLPSLPVPATTFGAHYWKKLPCGVIRSFNFRGSDHSDPSVLFLFLLAAAVDFCPLMLVAAVVVPLLVPCGFCPPWGVFLLVVVSGVFCLVLWASWGFCPPWAVSVRCCDWRLALVFWGSGASARPGVFVFFPWVVVLVFVFWRYGASACFAAFLFLLVAAAGMCPTAPLRLLLMVGVAFCASGFVRLGG